MKRYALAAAFTLLVAAFSWPSIGSAALRPRPSDLPPGTTHPDTVPDDFQVFNDYASPERRYSSARVVVHYVVLGIDAPPLNDDDADGVPDYVERVGEAADISLAYYEARGFRPIRADEGGPDARPDLYLSRFAPGSFGISLPATTAEGGAFAAVANNLDPSPTASFASVYGTVAHELFHLTQFSYVPAQADPDLPGWVLEGSAAGLETRVFPELDDIVDSLQQRDWFVAADRPITVQTYGAQLLWRLLDRRYPGLLQAVLARMGAHPPAGAGRAVFAETFARVTGTPFTSAFLGYAVQTADEFSDRIRARARVGLDGYSSRVAPFAVHYLSVPARRTIRVRFARRPATAALAYQLESDVAGNPSSFDRIAPSVSGNGLVLTFRVPAPLARSDRRATPLLIVANGGPSGQLGYRITAR